MNINNNFTPLAWHQGDIELQSNRATYAFGHIVPLMASAYSLLPFQIITETGDVDLSKSFRETAAGDYKKLGKMKQAEAENSAAAKKAKERQEAAEKREAEKSAKEAEKRAEQQEARRLFVARSQPRQANWAWDGENAPDGEQPLCTVPVEEYHRLQQELGYDGTQLVYLRVGNSKVMVVGTNSTGKIQLNTPAVLKIQAKPNSKKGEKYRVNGELGYSYQFTNAK